MLLVQEATSAQWSEVAETTNDEIEGDGDVNRMQT
jgi:hypothetical protein